ncbi:hypothetical protein [Kitasatospora sp. LaBMicrA B282]|uniref:hypothetical protein n=1 Tax=Kitasatospora sp. LaBMicrA B282 TaxID=3420949 RepID=UPI003D122E4B
MLTTQSHRTAAGATALAALLTAGFTALPAHADGGAALTVDVPATIQLPVTTPNDPGADPRSALPIRLGRTGSSPLHKVSIDFVTGEDLFKVADLHAEGNGCTAKDDFTWCDEGDLDTDGVDTPQKFWLTPNPAAKAGATTKLHLTVSAAGVPSVQQDVTVTVGGPDLLAKQPAPADHVKPGSTLAPAVEFTNLGQLPTGELVVEFTAMDGLDPEQLASNCEYAQVKPVFSGPGQQNRPGRTDAICTLKLAVAPGEVYTLDPIRLGVSPTAYATHSEIAVFPAEDAPFSDAPQWRATESFHPGTGAPLTATRTTDPSLGSTPRKPYDNRADLEVSVDNTADFLALGSWAPQPGGARGTLTAGLRNDGPAAIEFDRSGEDVADVRVTLPQGVTATEVPAGCLQAQLTTPGTVYVCRTSFMAPVGAGFDFDFGLRLADPGTARTATVDFQSEEGINNPAPVKLPWDPNPANDAVTVTLGGPGAGATPSTAPTATPTAGSSATPTPAAAVLPAADDQPPAGQDLAYTGGGNDAGTLAIAGGTAVLLGGAALAYAARRRKPAPRD